MSRLEVVSERVTSDEQRQAEAEASSTTQAQQKIATDMLMMAIKTLSQRFVVAMSALFTLVTAASAFYLWMVALPEIDTPKIIALSIYSVFILAVNIWGRRK